MNVLARFDRVRQWESVDPLLTFALYVEAVAAGRIECDVCAASQMTGIAEAARRAIIAATGTTWKTNPLYENALTVRETKG